MGELEGYVLWWNCWSLLCDSLFQTFYLAAQDSGEHTKKQAVKAPNLLRPGWEIVPLYFIVQNIYRTHPGPRGRDIDTPPSPLSVGVRESDHS